MRKAVLITGGTGALGQGVVRKLVRKNYAVVLPYVVLAEWASLENALGPNRDAVVGVEGDAVDPDVLAEVLQEAENRFDGVDALIHLLGGYAHAKLADTTPDLWQRMIRLNLDSAYVAAHAVLPHLSPGSSMTFVGAEAATLATPDQDAYDASKAGVMTLTRSLAHELKNDGIRVNAIAPDIIDTEANRRSMPNANFEHWLTPDEVAEVIAYLLSDAASAVTGAVIPLTHTPSRSQ